MTIDNGISFFSALIVLGGSIGAIIQWRKTNKIRRSELMMQIVEQLRYDDKTVKTIYMFDYDPTWYNDKFHNGDNEHQVDKTLSLFNYICYLNKIRLLSGKEFSVLKYEITRTLMSPSVQGYLWNLHHFSLKFNQPSSFDFLIQYGLNQGFIPQDFKDKHCARYKQYLNF